MNEAQYDSLIGAMMTYYAMMEDDDDDVMGCSHRSHAAPAEKGGGGKSPIIGGGSTTTGSCGRCRRAVPLTSPSLSSLSTTMIIGAMDDDDDGKSSNPPVDDVCYRRSHRNQRGDHRGGGIAAGTATRGTATRRSYPPSLVDIGRVDFWIGTNNANDDDDKEERRRGRRITNDKRFVTNMALISTACSAGLLFVLAVSFSEFRGAESDGDLRKERQRRPPPPPPPYRNVIDGDVDHEEGRRRHRRLLGEDLRITHEDGGWGKYNNSRRRRGSMRRSLEEGQQRRRQRDGNNGNDYDDVSGITDGDYSAYRCDEIYVNTPHPSRESTSSLGYDVRCRYATTCNGGSGLLLPFVFCLTPYGGNRTVDDDDDDDDDGYASTTTTSAFARAVNMISMPTYLWLMILAPSLLLLLTLLFRMMGSSADEYFSPSLTMFSDRLGLPPRFAGVTLLALGNGASDVSATMNAISSDNGYGYQMSLGGLTGGAMFVTTVVAGCVVFTAGGVPCRGALVRDVMALGITVIVVASTLERGVIGPGVRGPVHATSCMSFCIRRACYFSSRLITTASSLSLSLSRSLSQNKMRILQLATAADGKALPIHVRSIRPDSARRRRIPPRRGAATDTTRR
jgi:hypothetical protein